MLHVDRDKPKQFLPPFAGAGLVQVLVLVPPPQVLVHDDHQVNLPCTGTDANERVRIDQKGW